MQIAAAGKTGTSRDGWFIGFTGDLLCAVWVGYDDNRELELEGAQSALPVWTEFMKRATQIREYARPLNRKPPADLVPVTIDPETALLAGPSCSSTRVVYVSASGKPLGICRHEEADTDAERTGLVVPIALQ